MDSPPPPPEHTSSSARRAVQNAAQRFGSYLFTHIIAEGGMGVIFAAEHALIGRKVALKIVNPKYAAREGYSPDLIESFLHEARVMGSVDHPHVVTLYDAGVVGQCPFLAMRLVVGGDLGSQVANHGPLDVRQSLELLRACALGLKAVHVAGWVNRDFKPANVLLERDLTPRITDFGLAVHVGTQPPVDHIAGTPCYLAPEQIDGRPLDQRCDLYALGATIFFAACGQMPFAADTPEATIATIRAAQQPPTLFPEARDPYQRGLSMIVERAMAIDPERRYQDALEIVHDCEMALNGGEPEYALIGSKSRRRKTLFGLLRDRS